MPHYPGHLRGAFCDWIDEGMPNVATVEVNYEEQQWPAERLLGKMWNCSDIMPSGLCSELDMELGSTYAMAARGLLEQR
jgi:hypothetical protein